MLVSKLITRDVTRHRGVTEQTITTVNEQPRQVQSTAYSHPQLVVTDTCVQPSAMSSIGLRNPTLISLILLIEFKFELK